jgi:hypothetical protein
MVLQVPGLMAPLELPSDFDVESEFDAWEGQAADQVLFNMSPCASAQQKVGPTNACLQFISLIIFPFILL